jgi:GTP-binding protein EngB required for normal cell division
MAGRPDTPLGAPAGTRPVPVLNEHHRRHLLASCRYVDRLLSDIDNILTAADSGSPFSRYANDLSPALRRLLRDYFARLRADMLRILDQHHAMPDERPFSTVHSIRTALGFVEISIEELKPEYMRGYGEVPAALVPEINGLVEELQSVVRTLDQALAQGEAGDLHERLARLGRAGANVSVLATLERVIADQGLVEFRPALDTALARLEDQRFEIAVFGRVSSGKSSLLNHLLGQPVLPVGVTPITAVPTRVMHGSTAEVEVQFADRRPERTGLERLHEFVTEQDNPANTKHVTRLVVRVPAPRLSDGIVFVDTPGLGSLATSGAAEALAYLPRCDLGVVLIDAAATLTPDDVATVHRLNDAAIPAMVVMSKADLLDAPDLERARIYAGDHLSRDLGVRIGVHAVSVMPSHQRLLDTWMDDELRPLLARHRELARQSVQRKIGALRTGVEATLRARLARRNARAETSAPPVANALKIEQQLRTASGAFDDVRQAIDAIGDVRDVDVEAALRRIAAIVVHARLTQPAPSPAATMVTQALTAVSNDTAERLTRVLTTLADGSRQALIDAARALGLPDPATDDEWTSLMRELPQADPGTLVVQLRLPFLGLLGRRVATARIRGAVRAQVGAQITGALDTHARLLRSWGARALTRLRQQFDAQAQIYRAQLAGALAGPSVDAGTERALQELQGTTARVTPSV